MSPTPLLGLRYALGRGRVLANGRSRRSICFFCSLSGHNAPASRITRPGLLREKRKFPGFTTSRCQSTETATTEVPITDPRQDLEHALLELQTHAANYVNLSRLQLALHNLREQPGDESIRVTFLGVTNGSLEPGNTAKSLLRLVLADPLEPRREWETRLQSHDASKPLIVRIGPAPTSPEDAIRSEKLETARDSIMPEIKVSSPTLNKANLEMLLMEADTLTLAKTSEPNTLEDSVLVPTVDLSKPSSTHPEPITTPVHMALLVGDGILGAASILSLPILESQETTRAAVNFGSLDPNDMASCPFTKIDIKAGDHGLELFRTSVNNVMEFENLWTESNIGRISEWLRINTLPSSPDRITKPPVRNLIKSLLQNTSATIQAEEAKGLSETLAASVSPHSAARLNQALAEWSQNAHQELEQQLEVAFSSRPWRKLNWWKLFWRVDDVGMLSSDMLALRFLPEAERGIIYLAGRVQEASLAVSQSSEHHHLQEGGQVLYPGPTLASGPSAADVISSTRQRTAIVPPGPTAVVVGGGSTYPSYIPYTRNYLQERTVPALQALAQKLVLQSVSTAGLTSALGVLSYLSALGAYESGTIAALGLALSLRRLQSKWESARGFWEGEVREEGRKAVRATEDCVARVIEGAADVGKEEQGRRMEELERVKGIIERAEEALGRMR
ncbi:hypothetical protein QBC37DRAFT_410500 [Rhypophila decipiens]|uniref:Mmc1 C-terminal domain-containing protein n=1 Tax=Rhypophila decipiens TaxID=261697 RepID=A0AAN6YH50_9PEZI|nr:hypothetical protein QBC37DRAFT_410500 [Rhypophila decipiens]